MKIHLIAVGNSFGKTDITAMIMHVLSSTGLRFAYRTGSSFKEFESVADLPEDADIVVFEGDEFSSSSLPGPYDFMTLRPDIAILNGTGGEKSNEYATFEDYTDQYRPFLERISDGGTLIYYAGDKKVKDLALNAGDRIKTIPYKIHGYFQNKKGFFGATHNRTIPLKITGDYNMQNLSAAKEACIAVGVTEDDFYSAMKSYTGVSE